MAGRRSVALAACVVLPTLGTARASPARQDPTRDIAFTGYVVDRANMPAPSERHRLADRLGRFERTTHHQMAVATVTDLGGEDIAAFATRLANRWGVGRKGINDGVLMLIAPNQHATRIAVGLGLERQLPDRFCGSVLNGLVIPAFRQGRFARGIEAGVEAVIARLARNDQRPSTRTGRRAA